MNKNTIPIEALNELKKNFVFSSCRHIELVKIIYKQLIDSVFTDNYSQFFDFGNIDKSLPFDHDKSKFLEYELPHYVRQILGDAGDQDGWNRALMHHYKNNPHHWQFWLQDYQTVGEEANCSPREMAFEYILEMIANWLADSYQYNNTLIITDWLNENVSGNKMILHPKSRELLNSVLACIGYSRKWNDYFYNEWCSFSGLLDREIGEAGDIQLERQIAEKIYNIKTVVVAGKKYFSDTGLSYSVQQDLSDSDDSYDIKKDDWLGENENKYLKALPLWSVNVIEAWGVVNTCFGWRKCFLGREEEFKEMLSKKITLTCGTGRLAKAICETILEMADEEK